jgi:transaldolase
MFNRAFTQATKPALGPGRDGVTTEPSLYRKRGKPERAMAEIRRALLRKISARLKKERAAHVLTKDSDLWPRINVENEI